MISIKSFLRLLEASKLWNRKSCIVITVDSTDVSRRERRETAGNEEVQVIYCALLNELRNKSDICHVNGVLPRCVSDNYSLREARGVNERLYDV